MKNKQDLYGWLNGLKAESIVIGEVDPLPPFDGRHKFVIVGPARSGKDTTAMMLSKCCSHSGLHIRYNGSTSLCMLPLVQRVFEQFTAEYMQPKNFYHQRAELRQFWFECIKAYRLLNPFTTILTSLARSDILCGCRDIEEIFSAINIMKTCTVIYVTSGVEDNSDPTWPYNIGTFTELLRARFPGIQLALLPGDPAKMLPPLGKIVDLQIKPFGYGPPLSSYINNGVFFGDVLRDREVTLNLGDW